MIEELKAGQVVEFTCISTVGVNFFSSIKNPYRVKVLGIIAPENKGGLGNSWLRHVDGRVWYYWVEPLSEGGHFLGGHVTHSDLKPLGTIGGALYGSRPTAGKS